MDKIMDWVVENIGKSAIILGGVMFGLILMIAASVDSGLGKLMDHYTIKNACEAQGGVYYNERCLQPLDVIPLEKTVEKPK